MLLYHADMPWLPGGFLGVEVFFVISGYLITMLLSREFRTTSTISLGHFWLRRARRLLAALYALLAIVSLFVLLFFREEANKLAAQVWSALAYVTNWYFIFSEQSYFAAVDRPPVFQHLWSLAIEEQFYLVWPLLLLGLLMLTRGNRYVVSLVVTAGAIASWVWMAVLFDPVADPSRVYYGTDTRAAGLLLGSALALVWRPGQSWRGNDEVKTVSLDLVGMGAVAVLVVCFAQMREFDSFLYRGGFVVVDIAAAVAIMAAVHPSTVLGRFVLAHPVLGWIGTRSYALYLWHWPIFVFTRPEIDWPLGRYASLVIRLALTAIAAELSYRYIEVPIRNGAFGRWRARLARRHGARRRAGPIALASVAGLLLLAVNTVDAGTPSDLERAGGTEEATVTLPAAAVSTTAAPASTAPAVAPASTDPADTVAGAVATTTPLDTATSTTTAPFGNTVTVLGDSVLLGAEDAIKEELGAAGYVVDYRARPALMLHQSNDELQAANVPVGDTVIIGLGHNSLWERDRVDFDDWSAKFDREADELLATVEGLGAKRIIWVTLREPSEAVIPPEGRKQWDLYVWYFPYVNERLHELVKRHPEVTLADWAAVSNVEGVTYDAMHLTSSGTRLMIDTIRQAGGL